MPAFNLIALDADDTLWHNELHYRQTRDEFVRLLAGTAPEQTIIDTLDATEGRNLEVFGFGIKAYTLSLIETSIELTGGKVTGAEVQQIINLARWLLNHEIELLDGVAETLPILASRCRLMLITKGDLLDQERKLARSGLEQYFQEIEIISQKDKASYARLLQRYDLAPERFLMVGNSLRSDILPVMELGGSGVYIPFEITWLHEHAETPPADAHGFYQLHSFSELPVLLSRLDQC
jgi:putative hydrolase of the HAD superfamily